MAPAPIFEQSLTYVQSAAGLENVLRLIQSICQVAGSLQDSPGSGKPWWIAMQKISLTRRFFRYFGYFPCLDRAVTVLADRDESLRDVGFVLPLVEASKSGFMGLYLLLESFTILDAMDVYVTVSAKRMLEESFKFWFYALSLSILGIVWQLGFYPLAVPRVVQKGTPEVGVDEKHASDITKPQQQSKKKAAEMTPSRAKLMNELVAVSCDILVPGSRLGWIPVSDFTVGSMAIVSTLIHAKGRWQTVQRSAAAASGCN